MPSYRRLYIPGGTCFFTLVTAGRSNPSERKAVLGFRGRLLLRE